MAMDEPINQQAACLSPPPPVSDQPICWRKEGQLTAERSAVGWCYPRGVEAAHDGLLSVVPLLNKTACSEWDCCVSLSPYEGAFGQSTTSKMIAEV